MIEKNSTLKEVQKWISAEISVQFEPEEAQNIARMVLEWICGRATYTWNEVKMSELSDNEKEMLVKTLARLKTGEPIQYLMGYTWFYGRKFKVGPEVLIPRPETEEICHEIIKRFKNESDLRILDVGTGSGCIACTLGLELNHPKMVAVEYSAKAIQLARENAFNLGCPIEFIEMDFLKNHGKIPSGFDLVISNPPYIPADEILNMDRRVTAFEPHQALFTPSGDPYLFYRALADAGSRILKPGGSLVAELHEDYASGILEIFQKNGYTGAEIKTDLQGKQRSIWASRPGNGA